MCMLCVLKVHTDSWRDSLCYFMIQVCFTYNLFLLDLMSKSSLEVMRPSYKICYLSIYVNILYKFCQSTLSCAEQKTANKHFFSLKTLKKLAQKYVIWNIRHVNCV